MIYSSYYGRKNLRRICDDKGIQLLCVSRSTPKYFERIRKAPEVFPSWEMIRLVKDRGDYDGYKRKYWDEVLRHINVKAWAREYDNCVMLCWEREVMTCHRYLLGRWLLWGGCDYGGEL